MTTAELEHYRQDLLALQSRLNGDVAYLAHEALGKPGEEATCNLSHVPIHMADLGTASFEQQFTLSLMENEEQGHLPLPGTILTRWYKGQTLKVQVLRQTR